MELTSLNTITRDGNKIPSRVLYLLKQPLVEALIDWRDNNSHKNEETLNSDTIFFSKDLKNIYVSASHDEQMNIKAWGELWLGLIDKMPHLKYVRNLAKQCVNGEIISLEDLHLQLERMVSKTIYKLLLGIIIAGLALMAAIHYL